MNSIRFLIPLCFFTFVSYGVALCPAVKKCVTSNSCGLLPVPKKSHRQSVRSVGHNITEVRPGVFSFSDGSYMSIIVFKEGRLVLIDFPLTSFRGEDYLLNEATIEILGDKRPKRLDMVYGHRHYDHIGGAPAFLSFMQNKFPDLKTFIWGTSETVENLGRIKRSRIPKINVIVGSRGRTLELAENTKINLFILGGHTNSDLAAHILRSSDGPGIAYLADFLTPGFAPFTNFGYAIDVYRYIKAQEAILKLDIEIFSPAHAKLVGKKDIRRNLRYIRDAFKFAEEAADEVTPKMLAEAGLGRIDDPSAVEFDNVQLQFKIQADEISKICARKLILKYGCQLGGVDISGPSHCTTAFFLTFLEEQV